MSVKKGRVGESIAKEYLINKNYIFLDQNFYSYGGEIDLIMKAPNGYLVFIEVKSYKENSYVLPSYSITKTKRKRLIKTAQYFLVKHNLTDIDCRFDLLIVCNSTVIEHFENIIN